MEKVLDYVLNKDKIVSGKDLMPENKDFNICSIKHWFLILISWNLHQLRSAFALLKVEILLFKEEILNLTVNSSIGALFRNTTYDNFRDKRSFPYFSLLNFHIYLLILLTSEALVSSIHPSLKLPTHRQIWLNESMSICVSKDLRYHHYERKKHVR